MKCQNCKKDKCLDKVRLPSYDGWAYRCRNCNFFWTQQDKSKLTTNISIAELTRQKTLDEVIKLVSEWYDVSIKNKNIQLMILNGGYIHKPTLIQKLREMKR